MKIERSFLIVFLLLTVGFSILILTYIYFKKDHNIEEKKNSYIEKNTTTYKNDEPINFYQQYSNKDTYPIHEIENSEQNHPIAQNNLGVMYRDGHGVEKNYTKAIEWYQKAAEQNNADAQHILGLMYYHGHGVKKNNTKAIEWFQKAAEQNHPLAQHDLGVMYYHGRVVEKNYTKAIEWFQKAAKQNNADAQYILGVMYYYGHGVKKNYTKAIEWFQKAAEQNHPIAQNNLGVMYRNGHGVEKNYTKAIEWSQKAAEQNHPDAQYILGVMYYYGHGVKKNYTKAIEWFQKVAEQNHPDAQYILGVMYRDGQGVEKNYTKAIEWFQKAAEQNHPLAHNNLGVMQKKHLNIFTTASSQSTETNATPQKRIALIIGNGDYANGRLSNPANDAQDITRKLKALGFETTGRTNLGLREMKNTIVEFCKKAKGYDAAMFYYAGHGMQDKGFNYLVPIGAQITNNAKIQYECVDMNWVLRSMEEAGIKTKIIILDACRNNPVAQSWERSFSSSGLTAITSVPEGTFLVFAAQAGKVAKDGVGQRNSPYTKALLKMLDVPMLPIHDLFHKVKQEVANQTNNEQIPQETNNLIDNFYFNTKLK